MNTIHLSQISFPESNKTRLHAGGHIMKDINALSFQSNANERSQNIMQQAQIDIFSEKNTAIKF